MDSEAPLRGGVVQRVDVARVGGREIALLRVRVPGATAFVLVTRDRVVLLDEGAISSAARGALRGETERPLEARWRARLEGARIVGLSRRRVVLERDEGARLAITAAGGVTLADATSDDEPFEAREVLADGAAAIVERLAGSAVAARREALARALAKAVGRLERRVVAVKGDLARIAEADALAARAQLFVAEASRAPRGAKSIAVVDWSSGEALTVELPLDPARSAREQIDAMFKRARRLKEGARIGRQRLADAEATRDRLAAIAARVADSESLDDLAIEARAAAPRDFTLAAPSSTKRARSAQPPLPPHRTFRSASGAAILVGRGAEHNDALTFHVARPQDLWLHAKGRAGAHVIVSLARGAACAAEVLVDAAHLAAHFSASRDETLVEVQYTPRRYLRKPRGSAPGLVVVDREKVLLLRREEATLKRILESEEAPSLDRKR